MPRSSRDNHSKLQPGLFEPEHSPGGTRLHAVMYCDGASSGNPGHSGIGVVIRLFTEGNDSQGKEEPHTISEYIGIATNNVAEYSALIKGLKKARTLGVKKIKVFLDSELLVRQINGVYKVKNRKLLTLWQEAMQFLKDFDAYSVTHVRRELNKDADALARKGVAKKTG